jgi:hypothetical protein
MSRTFVIGALALAPLVGCGAVTDQASGASDTVARSRLVPVDITSTTLATTTTTAPDPWLEAVMAAENPIAVAYGLPDDSATATRLLLRSFERKKARCLQGLGFQYEPLRDFDPAIDLRNIEWINRQPIEVRVSYATVALPRCEDEARRLTYLPAALGESVASDSPPIILPSRDYTDEELRQMEIDYIVEHRDVLERLVMDLEVE